MQKFLMQLNANPKLAWESGWVFFIRSINTGIAFLTTIFLSLVLGAEGYGIYAFAYALVMLLVMPAEVGLPNLIVRETARGIAQNRPDLVQGIWRWSGRLVFIVSFAVILLAGPPIFFWRNGIGNLHGLTLVWSLLLIPLVALGNLRSAALRGLKKVFIGLIPEFIIRPALFLLLLSYVYLDTGSFSPPLAMSLNVLAALISFLTGAWMLWRNMPSIVRQAKPTKESRGWLTSSLMFVLIAGFGAINTQASTVILGLFREPEQVGIFRVAVQVSTLASFGLQTVNMVVAPHFADLYAQKDMKRLQRLATISAQIVLIFNLVLTLIFLLLGKALFGLVFGLDFIAAYGPLVILLAGQLINSVAGSVGYLLNMTGHEQDTTRGFGLGAGVSILLNLLLVPSFGIHGAAAASAVSMFIWNALLWWQVYQKLGINSLAFSIGGRLG